MTTKYRSRKFILALLVLATSTWLITEGLISQEIYQKIIVTVVGGYILGNVTQKYVEGKNAGTSSTTQ